MIDYQEDFDWGTGDLSGLSDEELIALSNRDVEDLRNSDPVGFVRETKRVLGRKFEVSDLTDTGDTGQDLYDAACEWLQTNEAKNHDLEFVRDIATKYAKGGGLTDGQAKGILNCMAAVRPDNNRGYGPPFEVMKTGAWKSAIDDDDKSYEAWLDFQASSISHGHYTVVQKDSSHTTIKISPWKDDDREPGRKIRWISYLSGPDNQNDYQWFARQRDGEGYVIAPKYRDQGKLGTALRVIFHEGGVHDAAREYALQSGCCARCNRLLTHPESIIDRGGYGPECYGKLGF